jgi:hypothetical protein
MANGCEQPVVVGDETDEEEAGNEDEGRPILLGGRVGSRRTDNYGAGHACKAHREQAELEIRTTLRRLLRALCPAPGGGRARRATGTSHLRFIP